MLNPCIYYNSYRYISSQSSTESGGSCIVGCVMGATAEGIWPSFSNSFTMSHISWSWSMDELVVEIPLVETFCDVSPVTPVILGELQKASSSPPKSVSCISAASVSLLLDSVLILTRDGSVGEA